MDSATVASRGRTISPQYKDTEGWPERHFFENGGIAMLPISRRRVKPPILGDDQGAARFDAAQLDAATTPPTSTASPRRRPFLAIRDVYEIKAALVSHARGLKGDKKGDALRVAKAFEHAAQSVAAALISDLPGDPQRGRGAWVTLRDQDGSPLLLPAFSLTSGSIFRRRPTSPSARPLSLEIERVELDRVWLSDPDVGRVSMSPGADGSWCAPSSCVILRAFASSPEGEAAGEVIEAAVRTGGRIVSAADGRRLKQLHTKILKAEVPISLEGRGLARLRDAAFGGSPPIFKIPHPEIWAPLVRTLATREHRLALRR